MGTEIQSVVFIAMEHHDVLVPVLQSKFNIPMVIFFLYPDEQLPNKQCLAKRSHKSGYQLSKSTQVCLIKFWVHAPQMVSVYCICVIADMDKWTDTYFTNEEQTAT